MKPIRKAFSSTGLKSNGQLQCSIMKTLYGSSGSPRKMIWGPRGHLVMSGDVFDHQNRAETTGIWWVQASEAAKHPTMHSTALLPNEKELAQMSIVLRPRNPAL